MRIALFHVRSQIETILSFVIPPVEIVHSDWITAMIYFLMSPSKLISPMAHGHGVR